MLKPTLRWYEVRYLCYYYSTLASMYNMVRLLSTTILWQYLVVINNTNVVLYSLYITLNIKSMYSLITNSENTVKI